MHQATHSSLRRADPVRSSARPVTASPARTLQTWRLQHAATSGGGGATSSRPCAWRACTARHHRGPRQGALAGASGCRMMRPDFGNADKRAPMRWPQPLPRREWTRRRQWEGIQSSPPARSAHDIRRSHNTRMFARGERASPITMAFSKASPYGGTRATPARRRSARPRQPLRSGRPAFGRSGRRVPGGMRRPLRRGRQDFGPCLPLLRERLRFALERRNNNVVEPAYPVSKRDADRTKRSN